ncbi:MAG: tripartite tricarboxylate transporter substrate binding protein [Burkholderiales bacterium]|nr:tripartite tricarboxylate transporter substrate binding protein [Burkholderiales bacterium]
MLVRMNVVRAFAAAAGAACALAALAQAYPAKPVRLVVPYPPGGGVDSYARVFGPKLAEAWGQPVIVENRPGAGGNVGAAAVARATPDGYTLLLNTAGQAIAPALYRKLAYDPLKDIQPIVILVRSVQVLVVNPALAAGSVQELVALAKAQPGRLNFGSTGIGSGPHLSGELLRSLASIDVVHVPYKGDVGLTPALLANEVQMAFLPSPSAASLMKSGKVRPLAVATESRSRFLPGLPTVAEAGVPGFAQSIWTALFAPSGVARDILRRISADGVRMVRSADVQRMLEKWSAEALGIELDEADARYRAEVEKYTRLVREANIPPVD